jgi:hypothetical protein
MFQSALSRMIQISDIGVSYVYWILVFVLRILFFISVGSLELAIDRWHYRMQENGCEYISVVFCCTFLFMAFPPH